MSGKRKRTIAPKNRMKENVPVQSPATPAARCPECEDMTSLDISFNVLTGHSTQCRRVTEKLVFRKAKELINDLVRGMESWARESGGIHADVMAAYLRAKGVLGEWPRPRLEGEQEELRQTAAPGKDK